MQICSFRESVTKARGPPAPKLLSKTAGCTAGKIVGAPRRAAPQGHRSVSGEFARLRGSSSSARTPSCTEVARCLCFSIYAVYAVSSLDTGSPLRRRSRMAVGTHQGVAGLAPRPFTLGEETGSHHVFMFIAPACSSAAIWGGGRAPCWRAGAGAHAPRDGSARSHRSALRRRVHHGHTCPRA